MTTNNPAVAITTSSANPATSSPAHLPTLPLTSEPLLFSKPLLDADELEPLPGSVVTQFIRCGKPGCHCQTSDRHGPYHYRVWREAGRVRKVYVSLTKLEQVVLQCSLYQTQHDYLKRLMAERRRLTEVLHVQMARMERQRKQAEKSEDLWAKR